MKHYYKGWNAEKDLDFVAVYDDEAHSMEKEEAYDFFADEYPVTIHKMGSVNKTYKGYNTILKAENDGYYFAREISETEYNIYIRLSDIYREVRMHDITGGFPREIALEHALRELRCNIMEWTDEIYEK